MVVRTSTALVRAMLQRELPPTYESALVRLAEVEEALRESEDKAKATFDQAAIGIAHQSLDEQWLWVNQRFCDIVGWPRSELLEMSLTDITHPDDVAASADFAQRARRGELPEYTIEKRYIRKDGRTVWTQLSVSMIHPPSGAPSYFVGFLEDITVRRRTEQRLAAQYAVTQLLSECAVAQPADGSLHALLAAICTNLEWDAAAIWTTEPNDAELRCAAWWDRGGAEGAALASFAADSRGRTFARGEGLLGRVWEKGEPEWVIELGDDPARPRAAAARAAGLHTALAFPVMSGGTTYGVIECFSREARDIDEQMLQTAAVIGLELGQARERSRSEEAMRESEERFRRLTMVTVEGVLIHEAGLVLDANPSFAHMFGYELHEVIGKNAIELLAAPEYREALREIVRTNSEQPYEAEGIRRDGSRVAIEVLGRPATYHGRKVRVTSVRDITERKLMEQRERELVREQVARAEAEAAGRRAGFLAEASRVLGASFDYETTLASLARLAVPALADFCIVDIANGDSEIARVGHAHVDPAKESVLRDMARFWPSLSSVHHLRALLRGESLLVPELTAEAVREAWESEEHGRLLDELRPGSICGVPLRIGDRVVGSVVLYMSESGRRFGPDDLALAQELARRAALAVENARLFHEAQRATRARDDLLGIVAHDLRNPLGTIMMATELLKEWLPAEEKPRESRQLAVVRRASDRMQRLIQDLLDIKRIETGGLIIEKREERAAAIVADAIEFLRPLATAAALTLEGNVPPDLPPLYVDPARIQQVLSNLVGNAIKFTPKGGRIVIHAAVESDREVRIAVSDTGPGIPADQLPHIFGRYWQGKRSDRRGVGLGLSIVKGIVEGHDGRVWVESRPGEGSQFIFTLPVATADRPAD